MQELENIRKKINQIDQKLSKLLQMRLAEVEKIGLIKRKKGLSLRSKKREGEILAKLKTEYEKEIFKKIITQSIKIQKNRNNTRQRE